MRDLVGHGIARQGWLIEKDTLQSRGNNEVMRKAYGVKGSEVLTQIRNLGLATT